MNKFVKVLLLALVAASGSLGLVGCTKATPPPAAEHPTDTNAPAAAQPK
jgi:hypothetical protein